MCTIFSHSVTLGDRKPSLSAATFGILEVCYHRGIGVVYGVFSVAACTIYTHHNFIYLFFHIMESIISVVENLVIVSGG